jgi:hypothetical protein
MAKNTFTGRTASSGTSVKAPAVSVAGAPGKSRLTHEQIAQRAKAIWQAKGCPTGQDEQNWREAEAQLKAELGIR